MSRWMCLISLPRRTDTENSQNRCSVLCKVLAGPTDYIEPIEQALRGNDAAWRRFQGSLAPVMIPTLSLSCVSPYFIFVSVEEHSDSVKIQRRADMAAVALLRQQHFFNIRLPVYQLVGWSKQCQVATVEVEFGRWLGRVLHVRARSIIMRIIIPRRPASASISLGPVDCFVLYMIMSQIVD